MRFLNVIDLAFQTLILGLVALAVVITAALGNFESIGVAALYCGFFLGPWQMVSSLITVISRGLFLRWRVIHLLSALAYIGVVSLFAALYANAEIEGVLKIFLWTLGFGIPTVLAVFYYYITLKSFQLSREQRRAVA